MKNEDTPLWQLTLGEFSKLLDEKLRIQTHPDDDELIMIDEIAAMTNMKKSSIYQHSMKGTMPVWRRGKRLYSTRKAIRDWLRNE